MASIGFFLLPIAFSAGFVLACNLYYWALH